MSHGLTLDIQNTKPQVRYLDPENIPPPKKAKPQEAYLDVHRVDVPLDVPFNVSLFLLLPIVDDFPNRFSQTESRNRMISQLREARFGTVEAAKMVGSVKSGDCPA